MHWIALQPLPETPSHAGPGNEAAVLTDPLCALGWWALRYSPKVALLPNAVLLEVSGSTRLWGGRAALLRQIQTSNKPVNQVRYGQGATSLIAYGRLLTPCKSPLPPDGLPLQALLAAQPHLATLARLGCTTWGQLRALPRGGLARRFGAALVDALDQAYGVRPDVYPWLTLPEVFEARLELPSAVESAPALLFGARRLLAQLQVWLRLRQRGVLALELHWQMDARRNTVHEGALVLRTAEPAQNMVHLQRLLTERLSQVTLPAPALWLRLRSLETRRLASQSASLLPDDQPQGDSLTQLLERLSARLGTDKVLCCQLQADHRPEGMQVWAAAVNAPDSLAGCAFNVPAGLASALLPTWLLTEPLRLAVHQGLPQHQGPLTLLAGPQRLEAGWWHGAAQVVSAVAGKESMGVSGGATLRDYFVACTRSAVLLWIFRERLGDVTHQAVGGWYLHGIFG